MRLQLRFAVTLVLAATIVAAAAFPAALRPPVAAAAPPAVPAGSQEVSVRVDGLAVAFDVSPRIVDGRVLVPFRQVAEALGASVEWVPQAKKVVARGNPGSSPIRVELVVGQRVAYVNGAERPLDVSPRIVDGRVLLPLRFFSEALGCKVDWDSGARTAIVESPPARMEAYGYYALGDERTSSWQDLFGAAHPWFSRGLSDTISTVCFGWYSLGKDGSLSTGSKAGFARPEGWERALDASSVLGIATEMMVFAADGDGGLTSFLESKDARARAVESIRREVAAYGGVNLDFEGLGMTDKDDALESIRKAFSSFVEELSAAVKPLGKRLTLTVHPPNGSYKGYDYASLASTADRLVIMAYGYGEPLTPEPPDLVIQAIRGLAGVPREKVILGISMAHENGAGVRARIGIAKRYGLAGVALWRLGLADDSHEAALRAGIASRVGEGAPSAGCDTGESQGYRLFSPFRLTGYGGYRLWTSDLDGDGAPEIVMQAVAGEQEGQPEEPPVYCAIHDGFEEAWRGAGLRVNTVADVNADGKGEIVCGDGRVYAYMNGATTLVEKDGALLKQYREGNFLPRKPGDATPGVAEYVLDLDGDGATDRLTVKIGDGPAPTTSMTVESKTKGSTRFEVEGAVQEVHFPRLRFGDRVSRAILTVAGAGSGSPLAWKVWAPRDSRTGPGYGLAWEGTQDTTRVSEYDSAPVRLVADLDGDGVDELVTNRRGAVQVFAWDAGGMAYELRYAGPDNGGLGFSQFAAADFDGDGTRELAARHITPTLYHNDLKIYRWTGHKLEGLADLKDIGWYASIPPVSGDFLGTGREQALFCTDFERCRPFVLMLGPCVTGP